MGRSPVFATSIEIAVLSLFRTISPDAGKTSPGITSASQQRQSNDRRASTRCAQQEPSDQAPHAETSSDADSMERRGCERETCCIRDKPGCGRLRSMSVPMEEREETDDHGPQGYRRPYSERNEHSQHKTTDKQMACSTKTICKPELAAAKPPNIAATKVAGHTTTARPPVNTLQRPTIVIAMRWSAPFRGC